MKISFTLGRNHYAGKDRSTLLIIIIEGPEGKDAHLLKHNSIIKLSRFSRANVDMEFLSLFRRSFKTNSASLHRIKFVR